MPVVFVHGNPETTAIWDPLLVALGRDDVVTLSPPGFGVPAPAGWAATSDDYLAWLVSELEAIDGPIDLIGHDWGGGHVQRLAATRPDLIRSWVTDIAGCADPEYVWHDMAQVWQTPGAGEEAVESMRSQPRQGVEAGPVETGRGARLELDRRGAATGHRPDGGALVARLSPSTSAPVSASRTKRSGLTAPDTTDSPSPGLASMTSCRRLPVTGWAVNITPADVGVDQRWTTTASATPCVVDALGRLR